MQYLLMIHVQESGWDNLTPEQQAAGTKAYADFTKSIQDSKNYLGGNRLTPSNSGTLVRVRDGKKVVTDGPFVEAKEQVGGYYLIEAKNLDEAIAIAVKCPGAHHGTVEVRPIAAMAQARPA
jgi:hypothetical protein